MRKSITIVGGGLAGLSLGIALRRRDVPVVLHEAGRYPRHRVCGEFIRGVDADTLEKLGVAEALADAGEASHCRWFDERGETRRDRLPVPARTISRFLLDQRLAENFRQLGGELREKSRFQESDSQEGTVWCSGRARKTESQWVGLKAHFRELSLFDHLEMHRGRGAYVGLCEVENSTVNVCGLFSRKHLSMKREETILIDALRGCGLTALAERLLSAEQVTRSACAVAALDFSHSHHHKSDEDRLSLGDAHVMIPPFTGNGMSMAFECAAEALDPLLRFADGALSWDNTVSQIQSLLRQRFRLRLRTAGMIHPFLIKPLPGASMILRSPLLPVSRLASWLS
ncbi:MAG: FAD-dependent monooxygenase [Verrucomicrobiota bacterium]